MSTSPTPRRSRRIAPLAAHLSGRHRRLRTLAALVLVATAAACGEDPFAFQWVENPRETTLYSLDREERNRPSAFAMLDGERVVLESPAAAGQWDFALNREGGQLVFVPPRAVGVQSRAGIFVVPNVRFDEVREAPADTASYITSQTVPVSLGSIYVVRTRQQSGVFGQACTYYGKVQPLEIDVEQGTLLFRFDTSPDCNNTSLVPPGS
jgi:hypothetical protein